MEENLVEKCDYNTLAETKSLGAFLLQLCVCIIEINICMLNYVHIYFLNKRIIQL